MCTRIETRTQESGRRCRAVETEMIIGTILSIVVDD